MSDLTIQAKAIGGDASCPLCSETLAAGGPTQPCPGCQVEYHSECLQELGGCGTLGCAEVKAKPKRSLGVPSRSEAPSQAIGVLIALFGGALFLAALTSSEDRVPDAADFDPPSAPAPAQPVEPASSPEIDTKALLREFTESSSGAKSASDEFVAAVGILSTLLERGAEIPESLRASEVERAREAYLRVVAAEAEQRADSRRRPGEVRRVLSERARADALPGEAEVLERLLEEIFAPVIGGPAGPGR